MSKIIDYLYLGSFYDVRQKIHENFNTKLIINVAKECEYVTEENILQLHYKYNDLPSENVLQNINEILTIMNKFILNKETVFVHCHMGKSRSVSIILAYLITYQNFNLNEAYQHIKSIRPICPNIGFIKQLIDYELEIKSISTLNLDEASINYIADLLELDEEYVRKIYNSNNNDVDDTIDFIFSK